MNPKMTVREVQLDLRDRGLQLSQSTVSKNIKSGAFPFGIVLGTGVRRTSFLILRKDYEAWADEYAPKEREATS